ncbi:MAG: UDP-N-acetylmuramoyl-L-alanyl-D-glutamate--2,6-diaminopimelate ligase [Cyanobacteriota bacterium]|nr:UDP-N-acetylmuramoyl-L-alanyl-D-glutamate--2,6-diaminopimelate ligase [Cyanobacteriota bacterium]
MRLGELLALADLRTELSHLPPPAADPWIQRIVTDSRRVEAGDLFVGLPGSQVDGGQFWAEALAQGAVAALVSQESIGAEGSLDARVITLPTSQIAVACARLAAAFYGFPGHHLRLIGVTGTNGKTTTTHLIEHLLIAAGQPTGLMGTLYSRWGNTLQVADHTTPFALELQERLAAAQQAGCQQVVMEVSSHALAQQRVWGCTFAVAVWTNLTQDHLDFHADMEDYWQAKAQLFSPTYRRGRAIINQDDAGGRRLLTQLRQADPSGLVWSYSGQPQTAGESADIWPEWVEWGSQDLTARIHTPIGSVDLQAPLTGTFNLANLLAAIGAVVERGVDLPTIQAALPHFVGVPGRMESVTLPGQDVRVIVDYAHTPDGLENLLKALRPLVKTRLICVFGCGGDRDRRKRPLMGKIAATWADQVVITSDNPRTEDPQQILQDILAGLPDTSTPYSVELDRRTAIRQAIEQAQPHDMVVIAGKGHEDYQILGKTKIHFDDREEARLALRQRLGEIP